MKALGHHIIVELSQCNFEVLCNLNKIKDYMVEAAKQANAQVLETAFHQFGPAGISGVVVIAESHLSIHTWPEFGYAAVDIYTCGAKTNPRKACNYLGRVLGAKQVTLCVVKRGIETLDGLYSHLIVASKPPVSRKEPRKELVYGAA